MSKIRVLVVDDSAFLRKTISTILNAHPSIEVIGTAKNGQDALEKTEAWQPDVITLDLHMPQMDGVTFLQHQMRRKPLPVVVCSIASEDGTLVGQAFEAGAFEYVHKPTPLASSKVYGMQEELVRKVLAAAALSPEKLQQLARNAQTASPETLPLTAKALTFDALLIGTSTGGPGALRQILPRFPANFPAPIGVVIHMPEGYTQYFASRLNDLCPLEVLEARQDLPFVSGRIVIGRAGSPFRLRQKGGEVVCDLTGPREHLFVPSVDALFQSGAEIYRDKTLGVILTGMGSDGTQGAGWIKAQGGTIIVEAESSAIIYGMPNAAAEAGLADQILPLQDIPAYILNMTQK